jgi:hypothetical protein
MRFNNQLRGGLRASPGGQQEMTLKNSSFWPNEKQDEAYRGLLEFLVTENLAMKDGNAYHITNLTIVFERDDWHGMVGFVGEEVPK